MPLRAYVVDWLHTCCRTVLHPLSGTAQTLWLRRSIARTGERLNAAIERPHIDRTVSADRLGVAASRNH